MKYTITFSGRQLGEFGAFHTFTETVEAKDFRQAVFNLHDCYDSVHLPFITDEGGNRIYLHEIGNETPE